MSYRIGAAKEVQADRLQPMCELMARIGAVSAHWVAHALCFICPFLQDISTELEKIDLSDKRLDAEMEKTQDKFAREVEDLIGDRAGAKQRLNVRIGAACSTLKREFETDKVLAQPFHPDAVLSCCL